MSGGYCLDGARGGFEPKPLEWYKHGSRNYYDERIRELIEMFGYEGYGRYIRLLEYMMLKPERGYSAPSGYEEREFARVARLLKFECGEDLGDFMAALCDLELVDVRDGDGRAQAAAITQAARDIERRRQSGRKGGATAAANRRNGRAGAIEEHNFSAGKDGSSWLTN